MLIARRRFLRIGGLSGLALAFPFGASAATLQIHRFTAANGKKNGPGDSTKASRDSHIDSLQGLDQASFAAQLNSQFQLLRNDVPQSTQLVLAGIFDFKGANRNNTTTALTQESFSLTFRSTEAFPLVQDVYTLRHARLGTFSLLLVPGSADGQTFEAVINRLHA